MYYLLNRVLPGGELVRFRHSPADDDTFSGRGIGVGDFAALAAPRDAVSIVEFDAWADFCDEHDPAELVPCDLTRIVLPVRTEARSET